MTAKLSVKLVTVLERKTRMFRHQSAILVKEMGLRKINCSRKRQFVKLVKGLDL
jgi:hypothetical protein